MWKLLIDKDVSNTEFRKAISLSGSTYSKLKNNECITTDTLIKVCNYLNCNISDIVDCEEVTNES
ncbi:helix-turn-helix transcriptional regulator [Globicatella sulfidifaciens]|uniref:helix-turn-helix domain-containing protein n=1 Tax=Globicatella sulfidifaciens TaxID=136093 RepID=UPI00288F90B1|nr:helix-turn-helix transcriptional regulator [Globicatella sulfidifaciens]MDT2768033.1 helix-turn-helix transcriptional regulator [Globicatella sulfidifaciens]